MDSGDNEHDSTAMGREAAGAASDGEDGEAGEAGGKTSGADGDRPLGRFHRLRRRPWLTLSAAAVLLAAAVAVPVAAKESEPACWQVPASVRDLADEPAAATKALDPGDDLARLDSAMTMLAHEHVCGDGARVLGEVVGAATGASGPGKPHTMAQARSAYAVAAALDGVELPDGLAPGVARMLAEYIVDSVRSARRLGDDADGPAMPASAAALDEHGYTWLGRFLAPRDAYAAFGYEDTSKRAEPHTDDLIAELAKDPVAFAILYDAERAYFAYYLEHLTDNGGDPDHQPSTNELAATATDWPDLDLMDFGNSVGALMQYRARFARNGAIPDLAAFDAAVRKHSRGTFRPAARQSTTREPMGRIAERPVSGPVQGPLMDGRYQLHKVLDAWAAKRDIEPKRAAAMRQIVDNGYVRGLWLSI